MLNCVVRCCVVLCCVVGYCIVLYCVVGVTEERGSEASLQMAGKHWSLAWGADWFERACLVRGRPGEGAGGGLLLGQASL
jgi:hypothetical protein